MVLTILLSVVLGYYALSFLVVFSRLAFHWVRAVFVKSVWFDMEIQGQSAESDPYSYFIVVPWFYEEKGSHFSFSFGLAGFSSWFVPVSTMTKALSGPLGSLAAWQILYDSRRTSRPALQADLFRSTVQGTGLSPGTDLFFFAENGPTSEKIERFTREAGNAIVPGRLIHHMVDIFDPPVFLLKSGNRWIVGCRDGELRIDLMRSLFAGVADKVLMKNEIPGTVSAAPRDAAERFMARGQVKWWMKGRMEGSEVVIEGDGLRPGEVTSADWALVTIPVDRRS